MCGKAVENDPTILRTLIKSSLLTAVKKCSYASIHVRYQHKNQWICGIATLKDSRMLKLILN